MSTPNQVSKPGARHSIGGAIKEAMRRRGVRLRELAEAAEIPYRTLQNYLLDTSPIPARALAQVAEVLDVSADWLVSGREPNIDKETLKLVLDYFDEFIRPTMEKSGADRAADEFIKLYRRIYIHHYKFPGIGIRVVAKAPAPTREPDDGE